MTTWNKELSREEAQVLLNHKGAIAYPDTPHNRNIIKVLIDELLISLNGGK